MQSIVEHGRQRYSGCVEVERNNTSNLYHEHIKAQK